MSLESSTAQETFEKAREANDQPESPNLLLLQPTGSRRRPFAVGFFFQIVFLLILVRLAAYAPKLIKPKVRQSVELIAPSFDAPKLPPPPRVIAPRLPKPLQQPAPTPEVQPPPVEAKAEPMKPLPAPPVPVPHVAVSNFASVAPPQPLAPPKPAIKTNVFAGSVSRPTIKAPVQQVQTGGFGDPNGFRGATTQTAALNAPKLGSFGKATGSGDGNGLAGANGRPGVVASAGFGSGVAVASGNGESPGGGVRAGGFGDARTAGSEPVVQARNNAPAAMVPVQIEEKPQPQYTQEARNLKIEGEVHLKVVFQADGRVHVLQVVHGLGHGLDEAAMAAAQKIRFKPAQRDGRPCDMIATVHIMFQLAS